MAKQRGCSSGEVTKWRKENGYTWHEYKDMKTMQKVPSIVHNKISHSGGISVIKKAHEVKMMNSVFGELTFNVGWIASTVFIYFGNSCPITLKVKVYFEEDGITSEQEQAYIDYTKNNETKFTAIELLLNNYSDDASTHFVPKTLLFERDGSYALLCDDNNEPDEGIAVCISPMEQIMSQGDYL